MRHFTTPGIEPHVFSTVILVCLLISSCAPRTQRSEGKESAAGKDSRTLLPASEQGPGIAPNRCRLTAHIVAVDSEQFRKETAGPCATYPCVAVVEIDSVLGYGSAFGLPLSKGQRIAVRFAFTMGPTRELFKSMSDSYPGLSLRSIFQADIQSTSEEHASSGRSMYLVNGYRLKE